MAEGLEKVLALAAPSLVEPTSLGLVLKLNPAPGEPEGDDDQEPDADAHDSLMRECGFYRAIDRGESPGHPDDACRPASLVGRPFVQGHGALVKFSSEELAVALTPRTPEASTVPKPTVPPGGPGLFHVKGLQLPPYVQHLYRHLVSRYGRHRAYGVAVGVVKKWAKGSAPGGKRGGKPRHTHPDVRAAAARNVALWEKDRAIGHAHGHRG